MVCRAEIHWSHQHGRNSFTCLHEGVAAVLQHRVSWSLLAGRSPLPRPRSTRANLSHPLWQWCITHAMMPSQGITVVRLGGRYVCRALAQQAECLHCQCICSCSQCLKTAAEDSAAASRGKSSFKIATTPDRKDKLSASAVQLKAQQGALPLPCSPRPCASRMQRHQSANRARLLRASLTSFCTFRRR